MRKLFSLLPFLVFLCTFTGLNFLYPSAAAHVKDDFPMFAAFIAIIFSFFTFKPSTPLNKKIEVFVEGASQSIIVHMCFIFLTSTIFTHVLDKIGGIEALVQLTLQTIPKTLILPGMFLIGSLFSFIIGSSMGTIAACMPIAHALALKLGINPALMTGTIICSSMFGDNLSILSDTTIAAVKITNSNMLDKIKENIKIALPASFLSIILLTYINQTIALANTSLAASNLETTVNYFTIVPYVTTLCLALYGIDILAVLCIGIILANGIGIYLNSFTFLDTTTFIFNGFYHAKEMVAVFILVLLLAGLAKIVEFNGGLEYLLQTIQTKSKSSGFTRLIIFILVCIVNVTVAINTISILIVGPVAKKISTNKINAAETATILDLGSCITQGILPYAPQVLLATSMASISPLSVLPYLYYQYILLATLLITFIIKK